MLPRSLDVGPLTIHFYGLIIAGAIYAGWYFAKKKSRFYKIPDAIFDDPILLLPLAFSIIGARIYHVLDFWGTYKENPLSILYIANGGLGILGALIGLITGLIVVTKIRKLNLFNVLDLIASSLLLGQAIGRLGNYINQEAFGPPTQLPWGVFIEKQYRPQEFINSTHFHPTFFYEALLNGLFFLIFLKITPRLKKRGQAFALYLIFYSLTRFTVEFWRIDTWTVGIVKIAQVITIGAFLVGIWTFLKSQKDSLT